MMNNKKVIRIAASGFLAVALVATCVGVFKSLDKSEKKSDIADHVGQEELAFQGSEREEDTKDVGVSEVEGQKEIEELPQQTEEVAEESVAVEESEVPKETVSTEILPEQLEMATAPSLNFTEESLMEWPVNGEVVLDYSMDHTIYFPTLNEYKYNPSVAISSAVGTPVMAVSNGKVLAIEENEETGITLTMDMGNGYHATYGQLKEVECEADEVVSAGSVIGYVEEPTKYYSNEGANLYFALEKEEKALDPLMYLP